MITLYARRNKENSIVISKDTQGDDGVFTLDKFAANRPRKNTKTIMYNCFKYKLVWL